MNPGFSSSTGVQIAMSRFNGVDLDAGSGTVTVGSGLMWDDVYAALAPHNVTVVGGRVPGVGVAGLSLGGGRGLHASAAAAPDEHCFPRLFVEDKPSRADDRQHGRI